MITATHHGKFGSLLKARRHELLAGVAVQTGGDDQGPNPHELAEAALAACTVITMEMYAKRKGLNVSITAVVNSQTEAGATHFSRELRIEGDLTPEQRQRLVQIADACPLHKVLSGAITISTELAEG